MLNRFCEALTMNSCHSWNIAFFLKVPFQRDFKDLVVTDVKGAATLKLKCNEMFKYKPWSHDELPNRTVSELHQLAGWIIHSGHFNRELQELLASSRRRVVGQRSDRAVWHSCPLLDMKMAVVQTEQHVTWVWKKIKHRYTSTLVFIQYLHNFQPFQIIKREREREKCCLGPCACDK